jgi:hypothetical protein
MPRIIANASVHFSSEWYVMPSLSVRCGRSARSLEAGRCAVVVRSASHRNSQGRGNIESQIVAFGLWWFEVN